MYAKSGAYSCTPASIPMVSAGDFSAIADDFSWRITRSTCSSHSARSASLEPK